MALIEVQKISNGELPRGGKAYFGIFGNEEPEDNPIQVFTDFELTQPLDLSISSLGVDLDRDGYTLVLGQRTDLYIAVDFSFMIRDSKGARFWQKARQNTVIADEIIIDQIWEVIGVPQGSLNMGPYDGDILDDDGSIKENIQQLETAVEVNSSLQTLDELKADTTFLVGDTRQSSEYNTGSGVGAGMYEKVSVDPGNNLINPPTSDSNWLLLQNDGDLQVTLAGVVFDGSDEFLKLKAAYDYLAEDSVLIVDGGQLNCISMSDFIRIKSNTSINIAPNSSIKVDASATLFGGVSQTGAVFSPLFGLENGVDTLVTNFSIFGEGKFIIEGSSATPVFIDVISCANISLLCDVDGIGSQANNKAQYGYYIRQGIDCKCHDITINNTILGAIKFDSHTRSSVVRCRLTFCGVDAQYPFNDPGTAVEGVDFTNSAAISMAAQTQCEAVSNDIEITGGAAIIFRSGAGSSTLGRIIDNTIQDAGKGAIGIGTASFAIASTVSSGHTIRGNKIYGFQQRLTNSGIDINTDGTLGNLLDITLEDNYVNMFNELKGDDASTYPLHSDTAGVFSCVTIGHSSSHVTTAKNINISRLTARNGQAQGLLVTSVVNLQLSDISCYNCARAQDGGSPGVYNVGAKTPYAIFLSGCAVVNALDLKAFDSHAGFVSGNAPAIFISSNLCSVRNPAVINDSAVGFKSAYSIRVNDSITFPADSSMFDTTDAEVTIDDLNQISGKESTFEIFSSSSNDRLVIRQTSRPVSSIALSATGSSFVNRTAEYFGGGSPEGVVTSAPGAMYRDITGAGNVDRMYQKKTGSGNTGWAVLT